MHSLKAFVSRLTRHIQPSSIFLLCSTPPRALRTVRCLRQRYLTTERIGRSWDGRITRASKRADFAQAKQSFECSLVKCVVEDPVVGIRACSAWKQDRKIL